MAIKKLVPPTIQLPIFTEDKNDTKGSLDKYYKDERKI